MTLKLGTVRKNRTEACPLEQNKEIKKCGRGAYDYRFDKEEQLCVVKWSDNKIVKLASSFVCTEPASSVKRRDKRKKERVNVFYPNILAYKHMGGVDSPMLIELYRTSTKVERWYVRTFGQCLHISAINAWLLFRRNHEETKVTLKHFDSSIGEALLYAGKLKRGRASLDAEPSNMRAAATPHPVEDVPLDEITHWPAYGKKGRCAKCKTGFSTMHCTKCDKIFSLIP